jgi:outer membrane protein assembly factor BamA
MRRLEILLASAMVLASSPVYAQEVRKLNLTGVAHVDAHDLLKSISTHASRCRSFVIKPICLISHSPTVEDKHYFDQTEFERDVLRIRLYYWKRGYRETQVDTTVVRAPKQVAVTFAVKEGQPTLIRKLDIQSDSSLISARTKSRLSLLREKDPLDLVVLDSMRLMFQGELWDMGYGDAIVDTAVTVDTAAHLADVVLRMTPNRLTTIGKITIRGIKRVDDATVRRALTFKSGDLYRESAIFESQRNLYESGLFRLAAIDVPPQPDTVKNVGIDVTEAPFHEARFGPGLNNVDFFQLQGHYSSFNLLGGARRLDIDGSVGNLFATSLQGNGIFRNVSADVPDSNNVSAYLQPTYTASIDFKQPSFVLPSDAASVGGFAHRSINPGVFIDRGYGGTATYTHELAVRAPLSLNYRYEVNRVEASDVYFCVNFGVCDGSTITTLRSHQSLSPLTLTGFVDRSDAPFSPTKGYVARLDIEHASAYTASDFRYNRILLDAAAYTHKSRTKNVFSAHLRVGFVRALSSGTESGVLHPRKRFYAGGANSVRGYGENQLGPRILTIDESALDTTSGINGGKCALTVDAVKFCDPNSPKIGRGSFTPQPLGGTSLLEGSVEYHFPLPLGPNLSHLAGAVFIDGGVVGFGKIQGIQTISNIVKGTGAITPGFGVRYASSVGPIRVDIGYNPNRAENLAVVTAIKDANGVSHIVPLAGTHNYSQGKTFLNRLALHFSIGEAY